MSFPCPKYSQQNTCFNTALELREVGVRPLLSANHPPSITVGVSYLIQQHLALMLVTDGILGQMKLRSHKNVFPNLLIFKGALKANRSSIPFKYNLPERQSQLAASQQFHVPQRSPCSQPSSIQVPVQLIVTAQFPALSQTVAKARFVQLNSRRELPALTLSWVEARSPKGVTPECQPPWLQIPATTPLPFISPHILFKGF